MKRAEIQALIPTITKDQLDAIMEINGGDIEAAKAKHPDTIAKADYDKLKGELDTLKQAPPPQDYSKELAELNDLRKYKTDTETKAVNDRKQAALVKALETEKAHPSAIKLLVKQFDLSKVELGDKDAIKGWSDLIKPVREENTDFFGVEVKSGPVPGKSTVPSGGSDPFMDGFNADPYTSKSTKK